MAYSYALFNSINEVPMEEWNYVCQSQDEVFMDPRFIRSVEYTMDDEARFWHLIVYDEQGSAVAAACIFLWHIDAAIMAGDWVKRHVQTIRKWWNNFLFLKGLFMGLPVSAGQSQLRIRNDADAGRTCDVIHTVLTRLSTRHGANFVVLKEFNPQESKRIEPLIKYGYLLKDSPPMHRFDSTFRDLTSCVESFRSQYRSKVRKSIRKAKKAGIRFCRISGNEGVDQVYTDKVHRLYELVLGRAEFQFEHLPAAFFRQISRQFGNQAVFSFACLNDAIVAFYCSLWKGSQYHMLFIGFDDNSLSRDTHLYFATFYHQLDIAMKQNAREIYLGQTSEYFKLTFGCYQEPRHIFVKARHAYGIMLKLFGKIFFPRIQVLPPKNVWRKNSSRAGSVNKRALSK